MKYQGSKNRHAKLIIPIMMEHRLDGQFYVEPFCGGCNVIDKVDGNRIANDWHTPLIEMWKSLVDGWEPPQYLSEGQYREIKENQDKYPQNLVGYVGFNSYGGKWFGGYRRDNQDKRDYWKEHYRNIMKQVPNMVGVRFFNLDYLEFTQHIPENSIVYCDPPYQHTTQYAKSIGYKTFWNWVRQLSETNHVFVSEYTAPNDFECVWKKSVNSSLDKIVSSKKATEKLFVIRK